MEVYICTCVHICNYIYVPAVPPLRGGPARPLHSRSNAIAQKI